MKISLLLKKMVVLWLTFSIVLSQLSYLPIVFAGVAEASTSTIEPAEPENDPKTVYDLVVLVVDTELDKDDSAYDGLKNLEPELGPKLKEDTLGERILRYAKDLVDNNELTDVKIIFYDKNKDTVTSLANALENFYVNGSGDNNNRLTGVVMIGDIPLPVINKNGNKYISLFPYTDFSEKAYIFDKQTKNFERNDSVSFPKPEIWHGVIRVPVFDKGGKEKLAEFFDKNHLYYEGEPEYSEFDRKLFFGDLVHEQEQINSDVFTRYLKYLEAAEDMAYFRFNKFWAAELSAEVTENLEFNADNPINKPNNGNPGFAALIKGSNPMANMPDIYSKSIIEQFLVPYYNVVNKYISKVNDFADYTARYQAKNGKMNVDSVPALISIKDEYTKIYLKSINDALEGKINEVVKKIEEPLPLLDYTEISGQIGDEDFSINVAEVNSPVPVLSDKLYFRYHYRNEEDGKFYINGIDADILQNAKQCSVYLGSTKSEYFDENLDFNPKNVNGEYSILTRAIRSDDFATATAQQTAGVNTRLLSTVSIGGQPSELLQKTGGEYAGNIGSDGIQATGAIIEDNPDYGISAFIHNPLYSNSSNYQNPLSKELQKGDVIIKVNGKNLSYAYTFDQAIQDSYQQVKKVVDAVNDKKLKELEGFPYPIKIRPGESLQQGNIATSVGFISMEFYRGANLSKKYFSFSVNKDGLTTREDPEGDPEVFVLLAIPSNMDFDNPDTYRNDDDGDTPTYSQGVIFTLYKNKNQGYGGKAYDPSAGCNAASTAQNGDRCFGMIASMPVLDPAGALAPVKMEIKGVGDKLQFPEKIKKNLQNQNSGDASDYDKHVDSYQFSGGKKYEEVDEIYYDSCYTGLPTTTVNPDQDSNPSSFPMDAGITGGTDPDIVKDFYGRLLDSFGEFVSGSLADDADYVDGDEPVNTSPFNPKESIWLGLDKIDAKEVVLNDGLENDKVTLAVFAKRYGLFDGVDNDKDGITDYEWRDGDKNVAGDEDGVYETKFYDFQEADSKYGISTGNLNEIARKLLSHDSKYTIPYGVDSFPYRDEDQIFENVTIVIDAHQYKEKQLSGVILHNEPTEHTITEQVKSQTAFSLPIDNPRYVAFQTVPEKVLPEYPPAKPKKPNINVEEIESKFVKEPHYYPGKIHEISYVNLFEAENVAQLQAKLAVMANELASLPGSYKIFGPDAAEKNYSPKEIADEILDKYLSPVINNVLDDPISGFELKHASIKKIYDAFQWKNFNIDEKHEYILKNYLNGGLNAYAGDQTLLPAPFGFSPAYGYEAAYLVLDGEKNYFDMAFNKDLEEETDVGFNPLASYLESGEFEPEGGPGEEVGSEGAESGGAGDEAGPEFFEFVWLDEFLQELIRFVDELENIGEFGDACGVAFAYGVEDAGKPQPEAVLSSEPLSKLQISLSAEVVAANGADTIDILVQGFDAKGVLVSASEIVSLKIDQDEDNPVFELVDAVSRPLIQGTTNFKLRTTTNIGGAVFSVKSGEGASAWDALGGGGVNSNKVSAKTTGAAVQISTYTVSEIEGFSELQSALKLAGEDGVGSGEGSTDGGGDGGGVKDGEIFASEEAGGGSLGNEGEGVAGDGAGGEGAESKISAEEGGIKEGEVEVSGVGEGEKSGSGGEDGEVKENGIKKEGKKNTKATEIEKNLKELFEKNKKKGVVGEKSEEGGGEKEIGGENGDGEDGDADSVNEKDIEILSSYRVEKENTEEKTDAKAGAETEKAKVEVEAGTKVEVKPESETEAEIDMEWEEYFMIEKYYQKFISQKEVWQEDFQKISRNLLAELPSDLISYAGKNPFTATEDEKLAYIIENNSSLTADGKSMMKAEIQIFNAKGEIEPGKKLKAKLSLSEPLASFEDSDVVETQNGNAVTYLRAGTKTGSTTLKAEVLKSNGSVDKDYPIATKELELVAGEVAKIEIKPDSSILVANNQSKTVVNIILKDKFGNLANNAFSQVALFVDEEVVHLDEKADINKNLFGVQLATFEGKARVDMSAKDWVGKVELAAVVMDYELEEELLKVGNDVEDIDFSKYILASKDFKIVEKTSLQFELLDASFQKISSIKADGKATAYIGVKLFENEKVAGGYNGPVNFLILGGNLGVFTKKLPEKLVAGQLNAANLVFKSSKTAGEVEILVDIPGFASDTVKFKTMAGPAKKIELVSSADSSYTNSENEVILQARLLDANGNLVLEDNNTLVNFKATEATKDLITLSPGKAYALNGIAGTTLLAKESSGVVNIIAEAEWLNSGTLPLKVTKHISDKVAKDFAPRSLYLSLLGGDFGRPGTEKNLAEVFLTNGQTQAVTSVTTNLKDKKQLFNVDAFGQMKILSDTVETKVLTATDSFPYQKIAFSDVLAEKELATVFVVPLGDSKLILTDEKADEKVAINEGIYVKRISKADEEIVFEQKNDGIYIMKNGNPGVKIDKFGRIFINDDSYKVRLAGKDDKDRSSGLDFIITKSNADLALISFVNKFKQDVQILDANYQTKNFFPGVYIELAVDSEKYKLSESFSGFSSEEPKGFYLTDTENELDPASAPGFGYTTLENARDEFGLGFDGNNKHMLLFSAGNSVGESYLPYASDVGIVYGDPMIRLKIEDDLVNSISGYTKDLGKPIFSDQKEIMELKDFDYNGDGLDDLLLVYKDGLIRLLENEISNKRFRDRGYVLNVYNGIFSTAKIDVNNDGYDDLLVGTKESCNANEECVSLFKNFNGNFERTNLDLALNEQKIYEMKSGDMDNDGCEDLVISDSSANISIFYNKNDGEQCLGLENNHGFSQSFGYEVQSNLNLVDNLFINYAGMPDPNETASIQFVIQTTEFPQDVSSDPNFSNAQYAEDAAEFQSALLGNGKIASKDVPPLTFPKELNFVPIKQDGKLALESEKQSKDVNGGTVVMGDEIEYLIVLKNSSNSNINNLMISDTTPTTMTLLLDSLKCLDFSCPDKPEWVETGTSLRSHLIKGISVAAKSSRILSYKMKINQIPEVHFDIGNDFTDYPSDDDYLDIMVRPEINPDGVLTYLYSTDYKKYSKYEVIPGIDDDQKSALESTFEELGLPTPQELLNLQSESANAAGGVSGGVADQVQNFANKQGEDKDYNGCVDSWSNLLTSATDAAQAIADGVQGALNKFRCSGGGCLPIPYNYAFLAPDGVFPGPGTPGTAVLAAGTSFPPYFSPMLSSAVYSSFRLYLSPTLTLGVGTAVCAGPSLGHASPCYAFALPGGFPGVCDALQSSVDKVISAAKNVVVDTVVGQAVIISDGDDYAASDSDTVSLGGSMEGAEDPLSANASANIRIPGFPSVLTNWMDKQIDEIYTKLLDFPTIYFILPDFSKFADQSSAAAKTFSFRSFHDFATSLSSFPFIQIEGKEIVIRVPAISPKEIQKYKIQAEFWLQHMKKELEKYEFWECDKNEERKIICDQILLDINKLISSVKKLLDLIDKIGNLPKDILTWRNMEAKYAIQIICYLDAIMNYTGGYINRQEKIIKSWLKAGEDAIRVFKDWQIIMDVIAEYQKSCDKCKNDRFSKLGLLLQIFMVIPEPPIIPLPKWPDLVVDFSQIKTGVKILWPDVVFRPQPIILPNLPTINLPEILPDVTINIDDMLGFNVPNVPDLSAFTLPNLPDLPPLPLPKLPDLPKPPKIPALPDIVGKLAATLKPIFQILCLLKNGLIPIPESALATEFETLTQPSVQAVLPIIKNFGFQWPAIEYSYVDQIKITGKLSFEIDTNFIYLITEAGAKLWNDAVKKVITRLNEFLALPYGEVLNQAIQKAINKAGNEIKKNIEKGVNEAEKGVNDVQGSLPQFKPVADWPVNLPSANDFAIHGDTLKFQKKVDEFNKTLDQYVAILETEQKDIPDSHYLTASQSFLNKNDPLLKRSLEEIEAGLASGDSTDQYFDGNSSDNVGLKRLADLRNSLIAYTKDLNNSNRLLAEIEDFNEFNKILVETDPNLKEIAALSLPIATNAESKSMSFSFFGEALEENLKNIASETTQKNYKLLAEAIDFNPKPEDLIKANSKPSAPAIGFYVATLNGESENVLNYTPGLKKKTQALFNDVDKDEDFDIVFSMGGDVYLKENYKNTKEFSKGDLIIGLNKNTVSDYVVEGGTSVQGVAVPYINNEKLDVSWLPHSINTVLYEIVLFGSVNMAEDEVIYKYFAVTNPPDSFLTIEALEKIDVSLPNELVMEIVDKEHPKVSLKNIENGTYYVKIYAYDAKGNSSLASDMAVAAPQSCADTEAPLPVVSSTEFEISIFKDQVMDASGSFDTDGEIMEYYIETLPFETKKIDPVTKKKLKITEFPQIIWSDLQPWIDNSADDDLIPFNDMTNPVFRIGPFVNEGDIGMHEFILHVVDQSGRSSEQKIKIKVFAPKISLDGNIATKSVASGETQPKVPELPFSLMRNRYIYRIVAGELKLVPRTEKILDALTKDDGTYNLSNFNLENLILVENVDGVIVAEINPETGNIGVIVDGYEVAVESAELPKGGTKLKIIDEGGEILGTIYLVADANNDVNVLENFEFGKESVKNLNGVNVSVGSGDEDGSEDGFFEFISLPANDPGNPGGVIVMHKIEKNPLASIDTSGNVLLIDDRMSLTKKSNNHIDDPLVLELKFEEKVVAEIYIDTEKGLQVVEPGDVPFGNVKVPSEGGLADAEQIQPGDNLQYIFEDIKESFGPEEMIKRKDFVKVLLKMLCIIPRTESYAPFDSGSGYADAQLFGEYHAYIKEATLLGLINGYQGEPDPETGLYPFKPDNTITMAEATKIILRALELKAVISLKNLKEGIPWYAQYLQAAQDLSKYKKDGVKLKNNFIITSIEATEPYKQMSFEELVTMVERVLNTYNCFEEDKDEDGMSDFCEKRYQIEEPSLDEDNDGLINSEECYYNLDPTDQDTDKGGVFDGPEFELKTNPLNPADDKIDEDNDGLSSYSEISIYKTDPFDPDTDDGGVNDGEEVFGCTDPLNKNDDEEGLQCKESVAGLYLVPAECNSCPCISTFLNKADILPGDVFFPIISKYYEKYYDSKPFEKIHIFSKGNEVKVNSVNK